ncbi:NrdJb [Thiohalospira sp.]|uniref:TSCPD domain-containing protein n=1 Tax=Thiohalospira sp. TaxID=3080549 RepID=UPI0039811687
MSIKIEEPIVDYGIASPEKEEEVTPAAVAEPEGSGYEAENVIQMHERLERPERLEGSTYKIATPLSEHAIYLTINDIVLNEGTRHEHRRPFEIFVNSKNMDHFQWIVALTRIISAVFRKGGDVTFLVEELHSVFDPRGGYFKKGGKYMPSLVAEIGEVIDQHLRKIGMIQEAGLDEHQKALVEAKRAEYEQRQASGTEGSEDEEGDYPPGAELCNKCHTKAMVLMDGCMTCLACGESKCG